MRVLKTTEISDVSGGNWGTIARGLLQLGESLAGRCVVGVGYGQAAYFVNLSANEAVSGQTQSPSWFGGMLAGALGCLRGVTGTPIQTFSISAGAMIPSGMGIVLAGGITGAAAGYYSVQSYDSSDTGGSGYGGEYSFYATDYK